MGPPASWEETAVRTFCLQEEDESLYPLASFLCHFSNYKYFFFKHSYSRVHVFRLTVSVSQSIRMTTNYRYRRVRKYVYITNQLWSGCFRPNSRKYHDIDHTEHFEIGSIKKMWEGTDKKKPIILTPRSRVIPMIRSVVLKKKLQS